MDKAAIRQQLEESFGNLFQLLESIPPSTFAHVPAPDKWSIGQHAMHLLLSTQPVVACMGWPREKLVEKFGQRGDHRERGYAELIASYMEILDKGQKAPPRYTPESVSAEQRPEVVRQLREALSALRLEVDRWEEAELSEYIIPHPALGVLTVREMLIFTIFHTVHHTKPMQQMVSARA